MTTSTPSSRPDSLPTITARTPEDLLAAAPVLIGFTPDESIAMLTLGPQPCFHARIDLPQSRQDWPVVFERLLTPVLAYGVSRVAFVVYAAQGDGIRALGGALVQHFEDHAVHVIDSLHADGSHWFPLLPGCVGPGVPYDSGAHPITAQSVLDGQVTFASRAELAASIGAHPGQVSAVAAALAERPDCTADLQAETKWLSGILPKARSAESLAAPEVARLLRAIAQIELRDLVWLRMRRGDADQHVTYWTGVIRQAPAEVVAAPAALLAFAAWLAGRGALAWCAVERCTQVDPEYSMAALMSRLLEEAVPPHAWEGFMAAERGGVG